MFLTRKKNRLEISKQDNEKMYYKKKKKKTHVFDIPSYLSSILNYLYIYI